MITSVRQVCYALMDVIERALLDLQDLIRLRKDLRVILEFSKSEVMAIFGEKLVSAMAACFQPGTKRSTISSLQEHAQTKFVSLCIGPLRDIWACLYCALGIAFDDPLLSQSASIRGNATTLSPGAARIG